jgi:hypothetical protein
MATLFGTIGIGYGGEMTYGQTLGFLREGPIYWGLLGCFVKGGVWGLLGGAVLGVGLTRAQYDRKTLLVALVITVVACYVGIKFFNEPKLIYFSNRVDRPRDESWAGLLLAALCFLTYLRNKGSEDLRDIPLRFALWGALGGALGFSGGALWQVYGYNWAPEQKWIGWWKMMEFSFGLILGSALGWCTWLHRNRLRQAGQHEHDARDSWGPVLGVYGFVFAFFATYMLLGALVPGEFMKSTAVGAIVLRNVLGVLLSFVFFGLVSILLGVRSRIAAWQVAVTLTFFHTVFDFVRDLSNEKNFSYTIPVWVQFAILLAATLLVGVATYRLQNSKRPVHWLFLLAVWSCYLTASVRAFGHLEYWSPPEGMNTLSVLLEQFPGVIFVHGTFTVSALITTWFILSPMFRKTEPIESESQEHVG